MHGLYYYVIITSSSRSHRDATCSLPKGISDWLWETRSKVAITRPSVRTGGPKIEQFTKRHAPELKGKIAPIWKNESPTTQADLIYGVVLQQDLPLKVADSVSSLSRSAPAPAIRRRSFHACGRVLVKAPNAVVEDCQFIYSSAITLPTGSDIGFWSESRFAENLVQRGNRFTHSITVANELTGGSGALGTIYLGMSRRREGFSKQFPESQRNHRG